VIAIGPMSSEVIEAVYKYSEINDIKLSLIASKSQIDHSGGYVNNWSTKDYSDFLKIMKSKYKNSNVMICRDHCGVGFNGNYNLYDVYMTIKSDIENGFDIIHMDFCHYKEPKEEAIKQTIYAIEYAKSLSDSIKFEIGTDEIGKDVDLSLIEKEVNIFLEYVHPEYYVVNTGSLVKEDRQVGVFNKNISQEASIILSSYGLKLKEHNADYLSDVEIYKRKNIIDAVNIAPQLGVNQTNIIINSAINNNIDISEFIEISYNSGKWSKWIYDTSPNDKYTMAILCGHYNFTSKQYLNLYNALVDKIDIKSKIINDTMEIIDRYAKHL
jgi:hypothetical protein